MAKEYKASGWSLAVTALMTWWWLGILTFGVWIVFTILAHKNWRISVEEDAVVIKYGALTRNTKVINLKNIQSVEYGKWSVNISLVGSQTGHELTSNFKVSHIDDLEGFSNELRAAIKRTQNK